MPGPVAYLTIAVEALGGLALILGVYARQVALALTIVLFGAIFTVHIHNGFFFDGAGWEYPAFWMVALLALALVGDGAFALKSSGEPRAAQA